MADKIISRLFPEMGIKEPGPPTESPSIEDITRTLSLLLSNDYSERKCLTLVTPFLAEKNSVADRRNYYRQVSSSIMDTKKKFLQMYETINRNIETVVARIVFCARTREQELKKQLREIGMEKIMKWDEQLSSCSEALKVLEEWESGCCRASFFADSVRSDEFYRDLEFVDSGEVMFDPGNYEEILKPLRSLGKITCHPESDVGVRPSRCFTPKFIIGETGDEAGQFCRPWGVCSDESGRILVCDRSNHRIQIFNSWGGFILQFGKEGTKPGEFNRPSGIEVDSQWRIIVSDKDNHRVQVFTYSGQFLFQFGSQGTGPGQFMYPWDVAANKVCHIAVSDSKNHRVQLFDKDGRYLSHFDGKKMGIENPRSALRFLDCPRGLAFRPDGKLLVTDFNNHRILLISETFDKVQVKGREGTKDGEFFRPQGIACDKTGRFAVADSKNYRVQVFDGQGNFWKSFGSKGSGPGQFDCPQGICFQESQNIIVVDFSNNRVQVF